MDYEEETNAQQLQQAPQTQEQLFQLLLNNVNSLAQAVEHLTARFDTLAGIQQQQEQQAVALAQQQAAATAQQQAAFAAQQQATVLAQQQAAAAATAAANAALAQQNQAPPNNPAPIRLPQFKMPSGQPPSFSGNVRSKPAHEAQAIIDEYLHKAQTVAALYKFRADNEPESFLGQPTYVEWISIGLTGLALSYWRRVPESQRKTMTWIRYKKWVHDSFTSKLTLQEAIDTMDSIKQKGSASQYSEMFNELVEAIRSANVVYQQEHLCVKYRKGLKDHLRTNETLFKISDDLHTLQGEAERLDDFHWRSNKDNRANKNNNNNNKGNFRQPFRGPQQQSAPKARDDPMELDNAQVRHKRLSDQEKAIYRANSWCTFCRSHDHAYAQCTAPGKQTRPGNSNGFTPQAKGLNNTESQTDNDE
jgi:hypothetical protein